LIWIGRLAALLVFLFSLAMGSLALLDPARLGAVLGFADLSDMGRNSVRSDIAAFFLANAVASGAALFAGRGSWIYAAALLYGLTAAGRLLDAALAAAPAGVIQPILVELGLTGLALVAARTLASRG